MTCLFVSLVFSGCFGSSRSSTSNGPTELVVTTTGSINGKPTAPQRYYIYCAGTEGRASTPTLVDVCRRLVAYRNQYFGTPHKDLVSAGPAQGGLSVRGLVDGDAIKRAYDIGASPQYPDWMRLLAKLRRT